MDLRTNHRPNTNHIIVHKIRDQQNLKSGVLKCKMPGGGGWNQAPGRVAASPGGHVIVKTDL